MNATNAAEPAVQGAREALYRQLKPLNLAPLWEVLHTLVTPEPASSAAPAHWRCADMRVLLERAGELISAEEAERRVLVLENPTLTGQSRITNTLYAGLQLILPGEVARCHRHTQSALRFVMEGEGAFTSVGGERAFMQRWDLVLTPNWVWHDHGNETGRPMIWLDGLDIPLVNALDASFAEYLPGRTVHPETAPPGDTLARYGSNLRPVHRPAAAAGSPSPSPLFVYPHARWRESLEALRRDARLDPYDGLRMEFVNPASGGSIMPTISAFCQLLPRGLETRGLRSTDGTVYVVVEGTGSVWIGDRTFKLVEGDVFVVPAWAVRRFTATSDLVLFSYSDRATQEKLGLWREHRTEG